MKIISIFNNKGGVGKTTLAYHLAHILAEMGKRVLILDLDSQCNMSLYGMKEDALETVWKEEESIIDNGFEYTKPQMETAAFNNLFKTPRTIHFLLKSVEEGISDFAELPPPVSVAPNLDLIPGRLTLFMYERRMAERWGGIFLGETLPIRTVTRIRNLAKLYSDKHQYDFVIVDTSPNLGVLNKVIISTVDGFIIPCLPDRFSLYGIKSIGKALVEWQRDFHVCFMMISAKKREEFPKKVVRFLGYTIYNTNDNPLWLTNSYPKYAQEMSDAIRKYIVEEMRQGFFDDTVIDPIGNDKAVYGRRTQVNMAQKYKKPIWMLPSCHDLEEGDKEVIKTSHSSYAGTKEMYKAFADDFLKRVEKLDE